jgi:hypothetical protein
MEGEDEKKDIIVEIIDCDCHLGGWWLVVKWMTPP